MKQEELQKKIAEYYSKLTPDVQKLFASMSWMENIKSVVEKYSLNEKQAEDMYTETVLVLLGIVHPDEYEKFIISSLDISKENADKIILQINQEIFKDIRTKLIEAYTINTRDLEANNKIIIDPKFSSLPQNVQEGIAQSGYQAKLYAIGTKYKLTVDKMGLLEDVTVDLINGKVSPSSYEEKLKSLTSLDKEKVSEMANDVNEDILKNIRKFMQESGKSDSPTEEDEVPIPPYKKDIVPLPPKKPDLKTSSGIFSNAGIEVMKDEKPNEKPDETSVTKKEDSILEKSGISMIESKPEESRDRMLPTNTNKKDAMDGIEHPADVATSIIGDKLGGTTISKNSVGNYSIPKINGQTPQNTPTLESSHKHDPYHETI